MAPAWPAPRLRQRRLAVAGLLAGLLGALGSEGRPQADDVWTDPAPGIRHLHRTTASPLLALHAVLVDLSRPELRPVATVPGGAAQSVPEFASTVGAAVAINGNYQGPAGVCGVAMGDGQLWGTQRSYQADCTMALGLSQQDNRARIFESTQVTSVPEPWISEVVTGKPALVRNGQAQLFDCGGATPSGLLCAAYARTAVGLSADGQTLYLLVVDKKAGVSAGTDCNTLATLLAGLGAADGFALEYGGAATLYVQAEGGLVNCPSDGDCQPRAVLNHLGLRYDPAGAWWGATLAGQSPDPPAALAPGATVERTVRYTNTGRRAWQPDGERPLWLAPVDPRGRSSALYDPATWSDPTRAVRLEAATPPGAEGTFRLQLRAAGPSGSHVERFAPVVEGSEPIWLDDQPVSWTVQVEGPADDDGDGYGAGEDCDDSRAEVHPGALELCNGRDDDCANGVDDGLGQGRTATLVWAASGAAVLKVNGRPVDQTERWQQAHLVTVPLRPGANVVAVEANRGSGRGGVLVLARTADETQLPSNSRWEAATTASAGWDQPGSPAAGFTRATVSAYFGQAPFAGGPGGLPEGTITEGLTWIWSAQPDVDARAYLRRALIEPEQCVSDEPGACRAGSWGCADGAVRCLPAIRPGEQAELCNGEDDDCDGVTDEHLAGCATAEDAGTPPPDLGPDAATLQTFVPPPRKGAGRDWMTDAGCALAGAGGQPGSMDGARPPGLLLGVLLGLAAAPRRRRRAGTVPARRGP